MGTEPDLFSITISLICIVDNGLIPEEGYIHDIQVHIVQAEDFEDAKSKALKIGYAKEHSYKNENGEDVIWKFKEIEYIRKLGKSVVGEVATRLDVIFDDKVYSSATDFNPGQSNPVFDE